MEHYLKYIRTLVRHLSQPRIYFGIEVILSGLLGIFLVFPILAFLLLLNELLRFAQKLCMWLVYGDEYQFSPDEIGSNYYNAGSSGGQHTILYLGELEGPLDVRTVKDNFREHVMGNKAYSKLKQIWQHKWFYLCLKKCENFNIDNHIRVYPGTENRSVSERELMQEILPELSQDMAGFDKPQWELVIIPSYQPADGDDPEEDTQFTPTKSLKIIRIHHSYMDGASTLIMIANTFSGEGEAFPYVIDPCKPLKISKGSMFLYKLTSAVLMSSFMIQNLLRPIFQKPSRFELGSYEVTAKPLFARTNKIPISLFQSIKEKSGVSMSAIVSAAISMAVRNLEKRYPHQRSTKTSKKTHQQPVWIVAGIFPYNRDNPCNHHIGLETMLYTSDMSGCKLLSLLNDELGRLAKNPIVPAMDWQQKMVGRVLTIVADMFLKLAECPFILSNIPLCTRSIKMWGNECSSIMGWVPLLVRTGLGVVTVRYNDHFRYCIQVHPSVMSQEELDYFVSQLELQVDELYRETSELTRKLSTDVSLFERDDKSLSELVAPTVEMVEGKQYNNDHDEDIDNSNNNMDIIKKAIPGNGHDSLIDKLKQSIEQIKGGINKIKEQ